MGINPVGSCCCGISLKPIASSAGIFATFVVDLAIYYLDFTGPAETLPEFIAHHTVEKLCLPCKLVLPKSSAGSGGVPQVRRKPAGMKQALQTGVGEKANL
jgi:hypothetical protein